MSFVFGFIFATFFYVVTLVVTKGFTEKLATYYGEKIVSVLNIRGNFLRKKIEESITQIDDVLLTQPLNVLAKIDTIVNKSSNDKVYTDLLDQTFKLSVLLEKYNANVKL